LILNNLATARASMRHESADWTMERRQGMILRRIAMTEPTQIQEGDAAPTRDDAFWRAHGGVGLVWSNRNASDSVMIGHALM
jgi:hypothetical protein